MRSAAFLLGGLVSSTQCLDERATPLFQSAWIGVSCFAVVVHACGRAVHGGRCDLLATIVLGEGCRRAVLQKLLI